MPSVMKTYVADVMKSLNEKIEGRRGEEGEERRFCFALFWF